MCLQEDMGRRKAPGDAVLSSPLDALCALGAWGRRHGFWLSGEQLICSSVGAHTARRLGGRAQQTPSLRARCSLRLQELRVSS